MSCSIYVSNKISVYHTFYQSDLYLVYIMSLYLGQVTGLSLTLQTEKLLNYFHSGLYTLTDLPFKDDKKKSLADQENR